MREVYICETHNVRLTVTEDRRELEIEMSGRHSAAGCYLLLKSPVQEGQHGECRVEKVSG